MTNDIKVITALSVLLVITLSILLFRLGGDILSKPKLEVKAPLNSTDRFVIEYGPESNTYQLTLLSITDDIRCTVNVNKVDLIKLKDNLVEITKE